jgi:hypothetical protein
MYTVSRTLVESLLVFDYLFSEPNLAEKKFRHTAWKIGGLYDRYKLTAITDINKQKKATELTLMNKLIDSLQPMPAFQSLKKDQQDKIKKGQWRQFQWGHQAVKSGFHPIYFGNIYNILCGYSHSSWNSVMQVNHANTLAVQKDLAETNLGFTIHVLAKFITSYSKHVQGAVAIMNQNPELNDTVKYWNFVAKDFGTLYDPS